jgi:hypothetical protein
MLGSSQTLIGEVFLETGSLPIIKELETDSRRVAIKHFMNIMRRWTGDGFGVSFQRLLGHRSS